MVSIESGFFNPHVGKSFINIKAMYYFAKIWKMILFVAIVTDFRGTVPHNLFITFYVRRGVDVHKSIIHVCYIQTYMHSQNKSFAFKKYHIIVYIYKQSVYRFT